MIYIPKDKIEWKKVRYLKIPLQTTDEQAQWLYEMWLNEPLASWDVFPYWEVERVLSMQEHLVKGDILFDIGTESGWCDLVYADMVGPENMVLIEPTPEFWPNIQALWEKNYPGISPLACFAGFFSDKTTTKQVLDKHSWPVEASGDLIDRNSYRYLFEPSHTLVVPQLTIDDYVEMTGIVPDALTMDTEGAELLILRGGKKTLKNYNLKVWVSEHDDLSKRDFDINPNEISEFMAELGYNREVLATDHERHVFYFKP